MYSAKNATTHTFIIILFSISSALEVREQPAAAKSGHMASMAEAKSAAELQNKETARGSEQALHHDRHPL